MQSLSFRKLKYDFSRMKRHYFSSSAACISHPVQTSDTLIIWGAIYTYHV